jgi:transportin-3
LAPRILIRQLCLSLADLLLQLPEWTNAVPGMIERFGQSPETVPVLLEFLTVLPQETTDNRRLDITVCTHMTSILYRAFG